jgi:hypothetical protein
VVVSDPLQPGVPARVRPSTVTVSSYLLLATAALIVVSGILSLTTIGATTRVYRDVYAGTKAQGTEGVLVAGSVISVVVSLLLAAGLVVLALLNNRGKNPARIVTWVVGGLNVCCSGFGLIGSAAASRLTLPSQPGMPDQAEIQRRLADALPSWFTPVSLVLGILSLLMLLVALVLLALPPSNAYFRKTPASAVWEPGVPGYPYPAEGQPAYPPYPGQPGYPPYPGQPGYPPYPGGADVPPVPPVPPGPPGSGGQEPPPGDRPPGGPSAG